MIGRFMNLMLVTRPALCVVDALICGYILNSTNSVATERDGGR